MALILSFAVLVLAAIALPFATARRLPEGVAGLVVNGVVSAVTLPLGTAGYFFWACLRRDDRLIGALGVAPGETLVHFLALGVSAGLIWAPVLVLALAALPRRRKEVQW